MVIYIDEYSFVCMCEFESVCVIVIVHVRVCVCKPNLTGDDPVGQGCISLGRLAKQIFWFKSCFLVLCHFPDFEYCKLNSI